MTDFLRNKVSSLFKSSPKYVSSRTRRKQRFDAANKFEVADGATLTDDGEEITRWKRRQHRVAAADNSESVAQKGKTHNLGPQSRQRGRRKAMQTGGKGNQITLLHREGLTRHEEEMWILHPQSTFRKQWDGITAVMVIFLCWYVPFQVTFPWWYAGSAMSIISFLMDLWFAIDLVLNFKTGYIAHGFIVMDPVKIREHYLHGWFVIDFIGTIPFELIVGLFTSGSGGATAADKALRKSLKMLKYLKLPKLLRLQRLMRWLQQLRRYFGIISVGLLTIFMSHICACFWLIVTDPCGSANEDHYQYDYAYHRCTDEDTWYLYARGLHTASAMLVGAASIDDNAGDVDSGAYILSSVCMLLGMAIVGAFFGCVFLLLKMGTSASWTFLSKMDNLKMEMEYYRVPEDLAHRVTKYYEYLSLNRKHFGDSSLLRDKDMSLALRKELSLHLYKVCRALV